ncbi:ASCH domain-containing protein [Staphylococcus arlettae]|uniref:ASCH domain n=2 Tax=Staphylococcus arlettae TaxID=29378 RepID=A0A380BW86_9STAP|nr:MULTISPECIES: ASCH domain-containing protein [Staphylococcus]PNZ54586.1 RNA-binding protein [Staphylococcus arlettae]GEQ00480.1 RNA-binding protein [Staphylococcus arlettae]SUJ07251.1 ASCH domain [Staphylococcus arlettae]
MESVKTYWEQFQKKHKLSQSQPEAWMFGDGSEAMGNDLGELVVQGVKRATCSAKCLHDIDGEDLPAVGQYGIILNGKSEPLCIIQFTKVSITPMNEVTEAFAALEGEGDLSYEYWYNEHERFFRKELSSYNIEFSIDMDLVCQEFKVVDVK